MAFNTICGAFLADVSMSRCESDRRRPRREQPGEATRWRNKVARVARSRRAQRVTTSNGLAEPARGWSRVPIQSIRGAATSVLRFKTRIVRRETGGQLFRSMRSSAVESMPTQGAAEKESSVCQPDLSRSSSMNPSRPPVRPTRRRSASRRGGEPLAIKVIAAAPIPPPRRGHSHSVEPSQPSRSSSSRACTRASRRAARLLLPVLIALAFRGLDARRRSMGSGPEKSAASMDAARASPDPRGSTPTSPAAWRRRATYAGAAVGIVDGDRPGLRRRLQYGAEPFGLQIDAGTGVQIDQPTGGFLAAAMAVAVDHGETWLADDRFVDLRATFRLRGRLRFTREFRVSDLVGRSGGGSHYANR